MRKILFSMALSSSILGSVGQVSQEWVNAPSAKSGNDAVIAVDAFGYIYVAGTYPSSSNGKDWKIIKYSPDSTIIWTQTKNGSSSGDDYVYSIAVDQVGMDASPSDVSVYLTGSTATSNGDDCTTIKITSNGTITWTATYNGSGNSTDIGRDIIVDNSGNVYVTGECTTSGVGKDVLTIKYNSTGTQQWANLFDQYNYNDAGNAMSFDGSGNIIVSGYLSTSTQKNALTIKYTTSGTKLWTSTYAGSSGLDDWANDVTTDSNDNIYVAGKTTSSSSAGDYLTVKYNSSGTQQWASVYDGPARSEDEATSLVFYSDNVYVTGKSNGTNSGTTTFDYATIKYDAAGRVSWTNRYNGPANGDDNASKIIVDYSGDLIVTGSSRGNSTGSDYYTVCYNTSGTSLWSERYNTSTYNGGDYATSLASDELGNIYITGTSEFSATSDKLLTIKYADPNKNQVVIEGYLAKLSRGLLPESDNDTIKDVVYASCQLAADSFYHIRVDSLIARATAQGLDLQSRMNNEITSYYHLASGDHVGRILNTLWINGHIAPASVEVPYYPSFVGTSTINDDPKMTYSHLDASFPISCINCSGTTTISEAEAETTLVWTLVLYPGPKYNKFSVFICNCTAQQWDDVPMRCQVCPPETNVDGVSQATGWTLMNHEIEIQLGNNNTATDDYCLDVQPININAINGYARINRIPGVLYWDRVGSAVDYRRIKKATRPIIDRQFYGTNQSNVNNWKKGDALSLCEHTTEFNSSDENLQGIRYGLAMGGVYQLNRPGINQQPLYFAFPYSEGLWFNQGPDMRVYYGNNFSNPQYCSTNGPQDISQDYKTKGCEFCGYYNSFANGGIITQSNVTDYLASTDYSTISGYWSTNAITVGFLTSSSNQADPDNVLYYYPNSGTCTPPSSGLVESLVVTQSSNESYYEMLKPFDYANYPNNQTYPAGTQLRVHVRARFANGNVIDACQDVTLDTSASNYELITVEIRGNINDYSSSVISYQIDVYELP